MPASLSLSTLEDLLRGMLRIRAFEDAAETSRPDAAAAPPIAGQEAVPVGVCAHLRPGDHLTATHRGHGQTLAGLLGQAEGAHGAMHIAVGAAHGAKLQGKDGVTVCFFGDAALHPGPFLESLNWARVYALPVLFVCEDSPWSLDAASQGASVRAVAMGVPAEQVDASDVLAVHALAGRLVAQLRGGAGPCLLHARNYRGAACAPASRETDAIARACARYLALGGSAQALQRIERQARQQAQRALAEALPAPQPALHRLAELAAAPVRPLWN
jgi:pyruvate dehydrogenase E1 component alpha subunit